MRSIKIVILTAFIATLAVACKNDNKSCHADTTEVSTHNHGHNHDHSDAHNHNHGEHDHAAHNDHGHNHTHLERTPLYKEVMAVHDEAMPWMGDIHRLIKKLNGLELTDAKAKAKVAKAIEKLEAGDEAMMSWMSGFDNSNEAIPYLTEQLAKAKEMRTTMKNALDDGNALYKELSHE